MRLRNQKPLKDSMARIEAAGNPLEMGLARPALERSAREHYRSQIVRLRLNKISNDSVNIGKEEVFRCYDRFIWQVDTRLIDEFCGRPTTCVSHFNIFARTILPFLL